MACTPDQLPFGDWLLYFVGFWATVWWGAGAWLRLCERRGWFKRNEKG